jgi:cytochrome b561
MANSSSDRYDGVAVALHWLVAILVAGEFVLGWWMQGIPKQPPGPRVDAFNLHKSAGLAILLLMLLRVAWRVGHRPPSLAWLPRWQATAARVTHSGLYALLLALPAAGYLGSAWSGYPVRFFGITLPAWAAKDPGLKDTFSAAHLALGYALAMLVMLHVAAAARHALVNRDGVLARMTFDRHPRGNQRAAPAADRPRGS